MESNTSNMNDTRDNGGRRGWQLIALVVMCGAVTGYFVGVTSPMNPARTVEQPAGVEVVEESINPSAHASPVLPATSYAGMAAVSTGPNRDWTTKLSQLKQTPYDPYAEVTLDPEQKLASLEQRSQLRAFNGAPPTIPHSIDQLSAQSCLACHGEGARTDSLRIAKISHHYLRNCTQCHVEQRAEYVESVVFRESEFVGLPAPTGGPRAFPGAPPVVPHSTWMRQDCLSCHGRTASPGLETTHAWRRNCLQCHAPSAELEQSDLPAGEFLSSHSVDGVTIPQPPSEYQVQEGPSR